jgi:hypothetical protein
VHSNEIGLVKITVQHFGARDERPKDNWQSVDNRSVNVQAACILPSKN